jgi:hypothetical protein
LYSAARSGEVPRETRSNPANTSKTVTEKPFDPFISPPFLVSGNIIIDRLDGQQIELDIIPADRSLPLKSAILALYFLLPFQFFDKFFSSQSHVLTHEFFGSVFIPAANRFDQFQMFPDRFTLVPDKSTGQIGMVCKNNNGIGLEYTR